MTRLPGQLRFVVAMTWELRGRLMSFDRLYAYPSKPERPAPDGFVILDSGAYALAKQGREIDQAHMRKLMEHYRQHAAPNVFAVAPDVYLDAPRSIKNLRWWHDNGGPPVGPVLQFRDPHRISIAESRLQLLEYAKTAPHPMVFVGNADKAGASVDPLDVHALVQSCRDLLGAQYVHNLGAGWNPADIRAWQRVGGFTSMDSISPWWGAKRGECWDNRPPSARWWLTAIRNAEYAQQLLNPWWREV